LKILIVEDDLFVQDDLKEVLQALDHDVVGCCENYEGVVELIDNGLIPDLAFIDIQLSSSFDGTDVAEFLRKMTDAQIIFLTSLSDDRIIHKARQLNIDGYLLKPFKSEDIKVVLSMLGNKPVIDQRDHVFIKSGHEQVKVILNEILYAEADDNYVTLYFKDGRKLLSMTMKSLEQLLPSPPFLRTNRSFIVNIDHIHRVGANYVVLGSKEVPVNESSKLKLNEMLKL
jgi:DNA-binding LytR/AlgR family response regulator